MRRKRAQPTAPSGVKIPLHLLEFVPSRWPGDERGSIWDAYARYLAWSDARAVWADEHFSDGLESMPDYLGDVPDAPFDPNDV